MRHQVSDILIASDLDGTIAFRAPRNGTPPLPDADTVPVEVHAGRLFSFMSRRSALGWCRISATGRVVLITTRSVRQYGSVYLPGPPPRIVFASNGGHLLVDGEIQPGWHSRVLRRLESRSAPLREIWNIAVPGLAALPGVERARALDGLFIVAHAARGLPEDFAADLGERLAIRGWRLVRQGRGVYLLPLGLDKAAACREAAAMLDAPVVLAGGDSWLDAGMLTNADLAIRPAHGELHEAGWAPDGVVVTEFSGALAGDQIIDWYAAHLLGEASAVYGRNWSTIERA